jgi:4-amino-4-deoxy-L-arabinose transferase-like glycosyltransferase
MVEMRRFTLKDGLLLAAVIAAAAGLRAGYLIWCADYARNSGPLIVETLPPELDELVGNLKETQRFAVHSPSLDTDVDTAWDSPGYPILTAVVGWKIDDSVLPSTMRWVQCGLGAVTAGLYFLFARRAFRSTLVAVLAGLLCALHPFWIIDTAARADGTTASFLLALSLFLAVRASQTSGAFCSWLYGLSLAALALVRAALLPFAFVALIWFLWRSRTLVHGWLCALLALLGFIIGVGPWTVRNWQTVDSLLPIVNSTYYHLWIGNKAEATAEAKKDEAADTDERMARLIEEPNWDRFYASEIWKEMNDHPTETVRRRLHAGLNFLFGEHWFSQNRLADPSESEANAPAWVIGTYPVVLESTMLILLLLGLLGWRWTYAWRFSAMPSSLALFWIPLPYILSHAEALSGPRLPLDGVLLCYAAFALACMLPRSRALRQGETVAQNIG